MQDMNHGVEEEVLAVSLNLFLTVAIDGEEPSYTASKRSQKKYKSDSIEICTVIVYENVLHRIKFLLRFAVRPL